MKALAGILLTIGLVGMTGLLLTPGVSLTLNNGASLPGWLYVCGSLKPTDVLTRGLFIRYEAPPTVKVLV